MEITISGIRGIYGQDLNFHEIHRFTSQFAGMIKSGKCVVAQDTRPSSKIIAPVVIVGLIASGTDVYNLGIAPTPAAFREARKLGAAIVVTASHNPLEWNGLKFILEGRGLFEDELETMLSANSKVPNTLGHEFEIKSGYTDQVAESTKSETTVKVGIDLGGGAACGYAGQLFRKLGHRYQSINGIPGISSRGPDPTVDELKDLRALVTSNKLDYGFAFDIDADRVVVVNSNGDKSNPDATLLLCVASAIEKGMKKFVTSIDTSVAIEKYVNDRNAKVVAHSKVGESNVVNKMLEVEADAGGEGSSAGFIVPRINMCRDGLLAAATISTLNTKTIEDCSSYSSQFAQIRSKIPMDSFLHKAVIEKLPDIFSSESSSVMTQDGVKAILDEDSWILVRPSNTEHAIRLSVESKVDKAQMIYRKANQKVQAVYDQLR